MKGFCFYGKCDKILKNYVSAAEDKMSTIYITGHRNPDLDSVCSAYAYAVLKNTMDPDNTYVAVRCGHLSDNVKKIFESLGIEPPMYKRDVFPRVEDVLLKDDSRIQATALLNELAGGYSDSHPSVIPIYDGEEFYGLLSVDDISSWAMRELSEKGNISTIPMIKDIMREEENSVSSADLFEEAKARLSSSKKRGLAVFDENGYVGYVTRRCFLKAPRHSVILMDHNEPRQSIMGIDTANIVEIIDHHRLDAVKTDLPIYIDAEPLGSTCTIVYRQFQNHGVTLDPKTVKVLLAGVVADTLILRSPTTTAIDIKVANDLARMAGVDLQEFGRSMFSNMEGLKKRNPQEAITGDFKTYNEKGVKIGISQCEVTTLDDLADYRDIYINELEAVRKTNGLDWAVLMITDVLKEHSILICTEFSANKNLQYAPILSNTIFDMPGVMSRKKQLLPEVLSAIGM